MFRILSRPSQHVIHLSEKNEMHYQTKVILFLNFIFHSSPFTLKGKSIQVMCKQVHACSSCSGLINPE